MHTIHIIEKLMSRWLSMECRQIFYWKWSDRSI